MPPNQPEIETPTSNDSPLSDYCRFARVVHSMLPLKGFDADFDVGVEQVDGSSSDRLREQSTLYADGALHQVMKTKVLQPELLKWYLQLQKFNFVVHDKGDPNQA